MSESEIFRKMACMSVCSSITCLIILAGSTYHLFSSSQELIVGTDTAAKQFLLKTELLWEKFLSAKDGLSMEGKAELQVLRFTRSVDPFRKTLQKCSKCVRLACSPGPSGFSGPAGIDGLPGKPGDQGKPGQDGEDVVLDPVPDLPCTICPAGLPGARGAPGERGWLGEPGGKGVSGPLGNPGHNGRLGNQGASGKPGNDGQRGLPGPQGKSIVAGIGAKGPKGEPGKAGFMGPVGLPGRPSNVIGRPGKQGAVGLPGKPGKPGPIGRRGGAGMPGEMGSIGTYCLSDCAKTKSAVHGTAISSPTQPLAFPFSWQNFQENEYYDTVES